MQSLLNSPVIVSAVLYCLVAVLVFAIFHDWERPRHFIVRTYYREHGGIYIGQLLVMNSWYHIFIGPELTKDVSWNSAAAWVNDIQAAMHQDFHLPSVQELQLAYTCVPLLFRGDLYWSSTASTWGSTDNGYNQVMDFSTGKVFSMRDSKAKARAFRMIKVKS